MRTDAQSKKEVDKIDTRPRDVPDCVTHHIHDAVGRYAEDDATHRQRVVNELKIVP